MIVNREALLAKLEAVEAGLATREVVEQTSCFAFVGGRVITFNDEIACQHDLDLGEISGAVQAAPLMAVLRKLAEDELDITNDDANLLITGKSKTMGVRMQAEIALPFARVEKPTGWRKMADSFVDAVSIVSTCVGKDDSSFWVSCVHVHPDYLEACDNHQITRYTLATGVAESSLVRGSALKHIVALGMAEMCETGTWVHFRNATGLILSCRRYKEEFPDLTKLLSCTGTPAVLPKGLADACDKAEIFSGEDTRGNNVLVEMRPGKLRLRGESTQGFYSELKAIAYTGEPISFLISPKLLVEICKRHNNCEISADRLKVDGGAFVYVTCLGQPEGK